jgi:hypothetical protein
MYRELLELGFQLLTRVPGWPAHCWLLSGEMKGLEAFVKDRTPSFVIHGNGLAVGDDGPHALVGGVVAQVKAQNQRRADDALEGGTSGSEKREN